MDLVRTYIQQRRFGDFVKHFIQAENERRKAEADKDEDLYLWMAFVHRDPHLPEMTFKDYKAEILGGSAAPKKAGSDRDLDDKGIQEIIKRTFKG